MKNAPLMKENIIWFFYFSPRKVGEGVIQKIKDDIMLANASHSLCAYSNLWARYHIFIENITTMMKIITKINNYKCNGYEKACERTFFFCGKGWEIYFLREELCFSKEAKLESECTKDKLSNRTSESRINFHFCSTFMLKMSDVWMSKRLTLVFLFYPPCDLLKCQTNKWTMLLLEFDFQGRIELPTKIYSASF